jgi:hypothetical protein
VRQRPTRNCHWVPESYLKAFTYDEGRTKIWRIAKPKQGIDLGEFESKSIRKVAVRNHLYVPRNAEGARDDSLENRLANEIEPIFDDPVWKLLQTEMIDLSWEPLRMMVALLVSIMLERTPQALELSSQIHAQMIDSLEAFEGEAVTIKIDDIEQKIDWEEFQTYRDWNEDDIKRNWISSISQAGAIANDIMKMRWSVLRSETPVFIASDNPVTVLHPSNEFRGLLDPLTTVIFPISPTHVLHFDHRYSELANQYYPCPEPATQNFLMWRNSFEHAFSPRHPRDVVGEMAAEAEKFAASI